MHLDLIRKIDHYLGPLIIQFILLFKKLTHPKKLDSNQIFFDHPLKKILIIKFFGMGSILLQSPALRKIKQQHPSAEITIFTLKSNETFCKILPAIDQVVPLSITNPIRFLQSLTQSIWLLRKKQFDVVIDFEFLTKFSGLTTLLITLFSKTFSIGFLSPYKWRNEIYSITVSFDHSRHISAIFFKVVSILCGTERDEISFKVEREALLKEADKNFSEINKFLSSEKTNFIICMNINAGALNLNRRWPEQHFYDLTKRLIENPKIKIILIGGKEDTEYVSAFYSRFSTDQIINLCGQLGLSQLIGLFAHSNILVTNDTGPLHIAYVMGLKTVSFFGPETPYLYGPLGEGHRVFYEDLYCSPCLNIYNSKSSLCTNNICLKNISPDQVYDYISGLN